MFRWVERVTVLAAMFFATGAILPLWVHEVDPNATVNSAPSRIVILFWALLYCLILLLSVFRFKSMVERFTNDMTLVAFVTWVLLSCTWSTDPLGSLTFSLAIIGSALVGVYIGSRYSVHDQITFLGIVLAIGLIASAAFAFVAPDTANMSIDGGALRGVYSHKNWMARMCILGALTFATLALSRKRHRRTFLILICLSLVLLAFAKSVTGLLVFTVLLIAFVLINAIRMRPMVGFALVCLSFMPLIALLTWMQVDPNGMFHLLGRDETLTGRTTLWALVLAAWSKNPWLGYGYGGFWRTLYGNDLRTVAGWDAGHAHNGFLEIGVELGVLGLLIFLVCFFRNFRRSLALFRADMSIESQFPLMLFLYLLVYNFTENTFLVRNGITWMMFVAMTCTLQKRAPHAVSFTPSSAKDGLYATGEARS